MTQTNLRGRKYSGDIYAREYGTDKPFVKMGNLSELSTKSEVESDELLSTGREDFGQAIESESKPKPTEITLKFNTFDKYALARALMGEAVDLSTAPTSFSDVVGKVSKSGWVKLAHRDIDPKHFAIKDKTGQKVDTAHYELNERLGMVKFSSESTLIDGDNFTYTGKTKGSAGFQIEANTLQSLPLEIYLDGKDRITGKDGILEIAHAVLSSDGDINWLSDDWWENGLSGKLVKDDGKPLMLFTEFQ